MVKPRVAVVLFNLGGPDSPQAVEPFLFNLFNDPLIIRVPSFIRSFIARKISKKRAPVAQEIYAHMGGGSPILPLTQQQATALEITLSEYWDTKVFTVMRYWHPRADRVILDVQKFAPERIILLPLYPQFSTTTTKSSIKEWYDEAIKLGMEIPMSPVCCFPLEPNFIHAHAQLIYQTYLAAQSHGKPRILFSAHGLPEKVIKAGDPYQWQVEQTSKAIIDLLNIPSIDYVNCYQSRVGPMKWITPSTESEIKRGGEDGVPLVIVPIAFVSEHSETLVELDIEYRHLAQEAGVPFYGRVPALGTHPNFIVALAQTCLDVFGHKFIRPNGDGKRLCPPEWKECPCRNS